MLIKNLSKRDKNVVTSRGVISFDGNGISNVADDLVKHLTNIKGYELTEEQLGIDTSNEETEPLNFENMTVEQLRQYAKDNNIDLTGASKKSDILAVILSRKV